MAQWIKDQNFMVLRDSRSRKALGVSYSEDGLRWISNKYGRLLYFNKAYVEHRKVGDIYFPYFSGDLRKSRNVYSERFIPTDHFVLDRNGNPKLGRDGNPIININNQIAEFLWINKASKMAYVNNEENNDAGRRLVFTTGESDS